MFSSDLCDWGAEAEGGAAAAAAKAVGGAAGGRDGRAAWDRRCGGWQDSRQALDVVHCLWVFYCSYYNQLFPI